MTRRLELVSLAIALVLLSPALSRATSSRGKPPHRPSSLTVAVSGKGKVTSAPKGIACRSKCRRRFPAGVAVRLTAKPSKEWSFWKWSGPCSKRKGAVCTVRMTTARSVRAVFRLTIALKATPSCARVPSADTRKVLAYLERLTDGTEPGVISGQMCPQASGICDNGYQLAIEELHAVSGKWVGMMSVEYEFGREFNAGELSVANRKLTEYWQAGGLILIGWSPANPWGADPQQAWRDVDKKYSGTDLRVLLPGGVKRVRWLSALDRIGGALAQLRDAGVVVLWRPLQEMNNTVYWWAKNDVSDTHQAYVELWRDMFDYFTCAKGLDNLLWSFAPTDVRARSSFPYPGDAYVDVVAGTYFSNELDIPGYDDFLAYGKPVGMSEFGPNPYGPEMGANGSFDNRKYAERLSRDYPRIAFWITPGSWTGVRLSLVDNLFASELMNDPRVIPRDKIAWR